MAEELVACLSEFADMSTEEIEKGAANFAVAGQLEWESTPGDSWEEKAVTFYNSAPGYLFDLVNANRSRRHLEAVYRHYGHWEWFANSGPDVLEFGGGLGVACSIFRELGRRVTYVDVDGPAAQFAAWYFAKNGFTDIEQLLVAPQRLELPAGRQWDLIFTDAVLEHVIDPVATVETLARHVRPGGVLFLNIDAHNVNEQFPMHREIYIADLLAGCPTLAAMAHVRHEGDVTNVFRAL